MIGCRVCDFASNRHIVAATFHQVGQHGILVLDTKEAFNDNYNEAIQSYKENLDITEKQFRAFVEIEILRTKMLEEITQDIPQEEEQVWARHILVATEEEAQGVMARLEAGEDFAALAQEVSTDTGSAVNGGDLGWFGPGRMVPEFETVAFELEIGEISDPVESQFGWHIIQKLGHEMRPIDDVTFAQVQQTAFDEWLSTIREEADIETGDTWKDVYPETPNIPPEYLQFLTQ